MRLDNDDMLAFHRRRWADARRPRTAGEVLLDWWNGAEGERSVTHRFHVFLSENGPRREAFAAACS
jgi:hypothetical protein